MSRELIVVKHDDLDGSPAEVTIELTYEGVNYEIDLSASNAATFRAQLTPWLEAAFNKKPVKRRYTKAKAKAEPAPPKKPSGATPGRTKHGRETAQRLASPDTAAMRAWALENGHKVGRSGFIPARIQEAWRASQAGLREASA